jgi:two-component system chemotaxis response regulator CheY
MIRGSTSDSEIAVAPERPQQPARVLVVDDQLEVCEFLYQIVELLGYAAVSENSVQRALQLLEEHEFDIIISDFKMPEMTGVEFFHAAVDLNPALGTRFIFLTGDLFNMETQSAIAALGVPILGKPFRIATVEQIVGEVLAKNRALVH